MVSVAGYINPSRILIFRGGALGDFILTLPAIVALRRRWPQAYIELAGYPRYARLGVIAGLIDKVRSLDDTRFAAYFQPPDSKLPPEEIKYLSSFNLIISYLHDPDLFLLRHLKESGVRKIIAVSPLVKKGHAAGHFCNAIENVIGVKFENKIGPKPETHFIKCVRAGPMPGQPFLLKWPSSLREKARCWLMKEGGGKHMIILHPGSGSPTKNWPADKFAALAEKIETETDFMPLVVAGEADDEAVRIMKKIIPDGRMLINQPIEEVASILSVSAGYVGNDSGVTHLAAALGIPVVALFGPTNPQIWAPRGKNVCVVRYGRKGSLAEISVEDVFKQVIREPVSKLFFATKMHKKRKN
jgi:heptosyltransferase-2